MKNNQPGFAALTDLQRNLWTTLLRLRFYNVHGYEPTVYASQRELANRLNAKQSEISNALKQLTARKMIAPAWTPRKGQVALYLILHPSHATEPDTRSKYRNMQLTVPGPMQIDRMKRNRRAAEQLPTQETGPDDFANQDDAERAAAELLAEQPDLEGYPDEEIARKGP